MDIDTQSSSRRDARGNRGRSANLPDPVMPVFIVYLALLAVAFFILIVRPQRRQMATRRALIQAVEVGDEIITVGGIYGMILDHEDTDSGSRWRPGVVMTVAREAVTPGAATTSRRRRSRR